MFYSKIDQMRYDHSSGNRGRIQLGTRLMQAKLVCFLHADWILFLFKKAVAVSCGSVSWNKTLRFGTHSVCCTFCFMFSLFVSPHYSLFGCQYYIILLFQSFELMVLFQENIKEHFFISTQNNIFI